jgi:hypothetical protein
MDGRDARRHLPFDGRLLQMSSGKRRERIDQFVEGVLLPMIALVLVLGVAGFLLVLWLP